MPAATTILASRSSTAPLVARVRAMLRIKALHDEVQALNRGLEAKVRDQVEELQRVGRLRRFLAPQLAQAIVSAGDDEAMLENHRREVVALFCDLRGFTSFSETAEPEDVMGGAGRVSRRGGAADLQV